MKAGMEGGKGKERGRMQDRREGARGGREQGSKGRERGIDYVREGGSGSGGRQGGFRDGTREEGT